MNLISNLNVNGWPVGTKGVDALSIFAQIRQSAALVDVLACWYFDILNETRKYIIILWGDS